MATAQQAMLRIIGIACIFGALAHWRIGALAHWRIGALAQISAEFGQEADSNQMAVPQLRVATAATNCEIVD